MAFMDLAKARYSVRKYQQRPIEEEKLRQILEAGMVAPTGVNAQPQRIYVLKSEEALTKIRGLTRCAFDAPVVLLVACNQDEQWHSPLEEGVTSGQQDVSIVATHMMLQAWELGIGSCWVDYFPNTETERAFGLPENERAILLLPLGYAAAESHPSHKHFESRAMDELVKEL